MPIPSAPLSRGDRGAAVAQLHRTLEAIKREIEPKERDARVFGGATEAVIVEIQTQSVLPKTGVFDADTRLLITRMLADSGPFTVYGTLTTVDGAPLAGATVWAYDIDLRHEEGLGQAVTDSGGDYEVRYSAKKFIRMEKASADVLVRAKFGEGYVVESPVTYNAPPELRIDLASTQGPSEFERLETELDPLLDGVAKTDLTDADVDFLAGETGFPADTWRAYLRAVRLEADAQSPKIPLAVWYGWQRTGQPSTWDVLRTVRTSALRASLLDALDRNLIPSGLDAKLEEILRTIPNKERDGLDDLLKSIALKPDTASNFIQVMEAIDAVSDQSIADLIKLEKLTRKEAGGIGLAVSLHRLVGANPKAITIMINEGFPDLPTGRPSEARDLAVLEPSHWARALKAADAPIPEGATLVTHARACAIAATRAFPEKAFRHRATRGVDGINDHVKRLKLLLNTNKDALDRDFKTLDLAAIAVEEREALRDTHTKVRSLVNTHPGLALREVLLKGDPDAAKTVATRIGWVSKVLSLNPDTKFTELDYLPDNPALTAINFGELSVQERLLVLADFRAQRRIHSVAGNAIAAQELMIAGFTSGSAVARTSITELVARTGIAQAEMQRIHTSAVSAANSAALNWFGIYDLTRDRVTTPVRVIPTREQFFYPLLGYASLVNDQPWCECEECQSVLSPAAYFVDLMHYVESYILADSFAEQPDHPLHLERRRRDLWELPLSCANTKDIIPTLDIVNEILEGYIREVAKLPLGTSVYAHLAEQESSFRQPFTLPIEQIETLLGHFKLSRHAVARSMRAPRAVQARARLGLSLTAYALVTTERTVPAYLKRLFGIETNVATPDMRLDAVEMQTLVRATGLDHDVLEAALKTDFVRADGTALGAVTIDVGKRFPRDIQNNTEAVNNLSFRRLDRLHRFVRLWRTLPWTVVELDYVLGRFAARIASPQIVGDRTEAPGTLERITWLLELEDAWSIPLEQLLTITDAFPTKALRPTTPLFDRLFNPPGFADGDGAWTEQTTSRFTHPSWRVKGAPGVKPPDDNTLSRLLAGLQLEDQELVDLIAGISTDPALDYKPRTELLSGSLSLKRASIASLYRHARVRALLKLSVEDFLAILALVTSGTGLCHLRNADDVRALVDLVAWREKSKFSVRDLVYLTGGARPSDLPDPQTLARDLPAAVAAVADPATRAVILAGPTPLSLFDLGVGSQLGRSPDDIALLRKLVAATPANALAAIVRVLKGGTVAADVAFVEALLVEVVRFHRLLPRPVFDRDGLTFLRRARLAFFGPAPAAGAGEEITFDAIRKIAAYQALATPIDVGFKTAKPAPDVLAIRTVIEDLAAASDAQLARALGTDEARIAALTPYLLRSDQPFDYLALLGENLALAATLGVSGEALARMIDESTFSQLSSAADDILGTLRAKYSDPVTLAAKLGPYEDVLRGRKRDGLVDYLITQWPTPFSSPDRLCDHFLVDVMVQGCARTSRVVCATSSVQLYVHRVLMNLERSADWNPDAKPPVGVWARFNIGPKRNEWQWRQYYRVWQANRRVFLYPENYIEPKLRDDKTPLFKDFEDAVLTQDLTPQNLNDAYSSYLTGFDGLAKLQIAGAFRDVPGKTLHLFGVTQDDAPVYYYRLIDESKVSTAHPAPLYSAWHKIDVPIPVRKVSPFLFEGRLYLFWIENATRPINAFIGGSSQFNGYRHAVRVRYSTLRLDGTWAAPQLIRFDEKDGVADARIVEDPIDKTKVNELKVEIDNLDKGRPALEKEKEKETILRDDAQRAFDKLETIELGCKKTMDDLTAAWRTLGSPPDPVLLIAIELAKAAWLIALGDENTARDNLNNCQDRLANVTTRLATLDADITDKTISMNNAVNHVRWDRSLRDHKESLDSYHPDGWVWDRVYPGVCTPDQPAPLPPSPKTIRLSLVPSGDTLPASAPFEPYDFDAVSGILRKPLFSNTPSMLHGERLNFDAGNIRLLSLVMDLGYAGQEAIVMAKSLEARGASGRMNVVVAPVASDVQVVMGQPGSIIVQHAGDSVWLRPLGTGYSCMRLGTSLTRSLARQFWSGGPKGLPDAKSTGLLDANFQRSLIETRSQISPIAGQSDPKRQSPFHAEHPWLVYYRETFLHIPYLIADHLNTEQDFAAAQNWYHTIFDPTAADGNAWRNRELAEPDNQTTTLRDLLVDSATLDAYRTDPFNPHIIARTRMSAYAKSIVMKYIDNLLDWGDSLFAQFTMESMNEATMLYMMARDILGPRPAMLGSCGAGVESRSYRKIRAGLTDVSDFLVELETPHALTPAMTAATNNEFVVSLLIEQPVAYAQAGSVAPAALAMNTLAFLGGAPAAGELGMQPVDGVAQTPVALAQISPSNTIWTSTGGTPLTTVGDGIAGGTLTGGGLTVQGSGSPPLVIGGGYTDFANGYGPGSVGIRSDDPLKPFTEFVDKYGLKVLGVTDGLGDIKGFVDPRHSIDGYHYFDPVDVVPPKDTVFCIPPNKELLGYWDRVEDRLFRIRNCMDISGARRRPDLFAPELDPHMLVRMKSAGLTIDDVLGITGGQVPAYRFTYLVDKAKQHIATVQSFGGQLLSALEKGDAEELNHLRTVHEQNILTLRRKLAQLEISAAEDTIQSLRLQKEGVEYRRQHFVALREVGTLPQERKQQGLQREASQFRTAAGIAQTVASILTIIPDFGAPTAMKFGGSQLGAAGRAVGESMGAQASFYDSSALMAGIEASVKRRDDEWEYQKETARREITQLDKSISAAEIKRDIAVQSLEVHERTVAQTEEMFEFFRERFASVDRYRMLAKDLRRLYKIAFDTALRMAKLAEQAYRAERQDDDITDDGLLVGGYWDAQNAGLLAGEKLLADLQRLERQYLVRNKRKLEIEQSFSLAQLAPDKLAELRLTGECSFSIPEWFFDLSYPGQYRRRIKAVRVTMPCVTGPYSNVGATLRLISSEIRLTAPAKQNDPVPLGDTVSIATSKGQLDAGVFEFGFRDERYMPFEGAGAISKWTLALPKTLRVFNYGTISDVIIHLSYTADYNEELARRWDVAAELVSLLRADVDGEPPLKRRFSLRDEFPDVFQRLTTSQTDTKVEFVVDERHFAFFLAGHKLESQKASIVIVTSLDDLKGATIEIAKKPVNPDEIQFASVTAPAKPTGGGNGPLYEFDFGSVLGASPANAGITPNIVGTYLIKFSTAGALAGTVEKTIDADKVHDIVLRVGYRLAAV